MVDFLMALNAHNNPHFYFCWASSLKPKNAIVNPPPPKKKFETIVKH
jgi:hypothetical protein